MQKIVLLISLSILLSACTLGQGQDLEKNTENSTQSEEKTSTYESQLREASSKIKDSEEFKNCMDMHVPMCIQNAGMQLAQKEKSTEFCNELSSPEQIESCVFVITLMNAQEKSDKTLCNTLTGSYSTQCAVSVIRVSATSKKDSKICDEIPSDENTDNSARDECVFSVIMSQETANKESCESIKNQQIKESCESMIASRPKDPIID